MLGEFSICMYKDHSYEMDVIMRISRENLVSYSNGGGNVSFL